MKGRLIFGGSLILMGLLVWFIPFVRLQYPTWVPLREPVDLARSSRIEARFGTNMKGIYTVKIRCRRAGALAGAPATANAWLDSATVACNLMVQVKHNGSVVHEDTVKELKPSTAQADAVFYLASRMELREAGSHTLLLENQSPVPPLEGTGPSVEIQYSRAVWRQRNLYALVGLLAGSGLVITGLLLLAASWVAHKAEYADFD